MKKLCLLTSILTFVIVTSAKGQHVHDDFQSFRQRMHNDYHAFKRGILDEYTQFLDNAWEEFSSFSGVKRNTLPKPNVAPVYKPAEDTVPGTVPAIEPAEEEKTSIPTGPTTPVNIPATPEIPTTPTVVPETDITKITIPLYGLSLSIPQTDIQATLRNVSEQSIASYWKTIHQTDTDKCLQALSQYASQYHLGDYCTFVMVMHYAERTLSGKGNDAQRILAQYLMLALGYDVRLAVANDEVRLLLPFKQQVYSNPYFIQQNMKFYIYPNHNEQQLNARICQLPDNKKVGKTIDLIINPSYCFPQRTKAYSVSNNQLSLSGNVNTNLIELMKEYPSMDIPCYASSNPDNQLRTSIIEQLKKQVMDMDTMQAVNALLHFVQKAFLYQTDADQFGPGVEKAFFVEETLYYPYCDCEDRAIFFAYLIRNILNLEVHIIIYPGHACTAVALPQAPMGRDVISYSYHEKTFYICDPTYIGANAGSCMPDYLNEKPEIHEW